MVLIFKHLQCDFFIDKNIANTGQFDLFLYLNIDYYENYMIQLNGSFKDFLFKFLLKIGSSQAIQFQPLIGSKFWLWTRFAGWVFSWLWETHNCNLFSLSEGYIPFTWAGTLYNLL